MAERNAQPDKTNPLAICQRGRLYEYLPVCQLNGNTFRVARVANRTLPFHAHRDSDELFYVLEGGFWLETDEGRTRLDAGDMLVVPKGTRHRPVVTDEVKVLLGELAGTLTEENS
ncbi:MAG: cupin domain-containing protein [Oscillospiraceae bacterium]|jgi:quercetin dioxygenase-like cupin family protein|nr:cupin domain-containing protein [Oscillospiraceae bacterium]